METGKIFIDMGTWTITGLNFIEKLILSDILYMDGSYNKTEKTLYNEYGIKNARIVFDRLKQKGLVEASPTYRYDNGPKKGRANRGVTKEYYDAERYAISETNQLLRYGNEGVSFTKDTIKAMLGLAYSENPKYVSKAVTKYLILLLALYKAYEITTMEQEDEEGEKHTQFKYSVRFKNKDIAEFLNINVNTITRYIKDLKKQGLLWDLGEKHLYAINVQFLEHHGIEIPKKILNKKHLERIQQASISDAIKEKLIEWLEFRTFCIHRGVSEKEITEMLNSYWIKQDDAVDFLEYCLAYEVVKIYEATYDKHLDYKAIDKRRNKAYDQQEEIDHKDPRHKTLT